ncbi:type II toxin-antitoxin system RnlA family toxin [Proteobacteria bacterium 005FR1]|nr:type II toxin-antitoxin system RnlA family toxin [Proteobacteria bacterium 005FR1]
MTDYKDLNLNRETLEQDVQRFLNERGLALDGGIQDLGKRKRVVFGRAGEEFAMVELILNGSGTTTVHWKMGKNQALGQELAEFLSATIDPAEFEQVNYSLSGFTEAFADTLLEFLEESGDFALEVRQDDPKRRLVSVRSRAHQDQLTITHHKGTRRLQIQGKPLSCYRRVVYFLTDFLDLKGLQQVLYRKDDSSAEIVRKEVAEDYLKGFFPKSYHLIPDAVKRLLVSSCCVKLASPQLPDYCLLLYPDLRGLEGVLKELLAGYNMSVEDAENGFGDFFEVGRDICTLKADFSGHIGHAGMESALSDAYGFYRKHRHTLFHMEEFPDGSRMVDTLDEALGLSKDTYAKIDRLYTARM